MVLEKTPRAGTKVLASGGTRCNLTTSLAPRAAAQRFGTGAARFLAPAFKTMPPTAVREHFDRLGVPTKVEPGLDKVFPVSDSAKDVRDALLRDALQAGARFAYERPVVEVAPHEGGWHVQTTQGPVWCRTLVLCAGGRSYPKSGTQGDGYPWLRSLDLEVVHPVPGLAALVSPASWVHALSGLTVDAEVRVGKQRERRPVLFTHTGLSGPGAMDQAEAVHRAGGLVHVRLDLLPDVPLDALRDRLVEAAGRAGSPRLASLLPLPRRLLEAVAARAGLTESNLPANRLDRRARHRVLEQLKGLEVPISGSRGWHHAEVTAGGLALHEVDRRTMGVKAHPGLYVIGELLDLQGPIGGLNFQAAFAAAELAARSIGARRVSA